MKFVSPLIFLVFVQACSFSHKLTDTDYSDLATGEEPRRSAYFPNEIAEELGWGDLASDMLKNVNEEFRFTLKSDFEPYHLFRISRTRKVKGESVLFWAKNNLHDATNPHKDLKKYLKERCTDFYEAQNFEYCLPNYLKEPNWEAVYSNLEVGNVWKIPDQSQLEIESPPDSNRWVMDVQLRLNDFYRLYTHTSPEFYVGQIDAIDIMAIVVQLQLVVTSQTKPDNFDVYSGITSGAVGSSFTLCDKSEVWRFDGDISRLLNLGGVPSHSYNTEDAMFYVVVSGTVDDEWYSNRKSSGFLKTLLPKEVNEISVVSNNKCPSSF